MVETSPRFWRTLKYKDSSSHSLLLSYVCRHQKSTSELPISEVQCYQKTLTDKYWAALKTQSCYSSSILRGFRVLPIAFGKIKFQHKYFVCSTSKESTVLAQKDKYIIFCNNQNSKFKKSSYLCNVFEKVNFYVRVPTSLQRVYAFFLENKFFISH